MGFDFLLLFAVAAGFWWLAGRLIDDVLDSDMEWWRSLAHEDISRRDDEDRAA